MQVTANRLRASVDFPEARNLCQRRSAFACVGKAHLRIGMPWNFNGLQGSSGKKPNQQNQPQRSF
jgi:hypothetical protein